jgi:hypothetical protein
VQSHYSLDVTTWNIIAPAFSYMFLVLPLRKGKLQRAGPAPAADH